MTMKSSTVPAGKFKAQCLEILDRVADRKEEVIVTKHGKPVARVVPLESKKEDSLRKSVTILGDIVGPILDDWEADQ
jgi:prevent-host-death family protein